MIFVAKLAFVLPHRAPAGKALPKGEKLQLPGERQDSPQGCGSSSSAQPDVQSTPCSWAEHSLQLGTASPGSAACTSGETHKTEAPKEECKKRWKGI